MKREGKAKAAQQQKTMEKGPDIILSYVNEWDKYDIKFVEASVHLLVLFLSLFFLASSVLCTSSDA